MSFARDARFALRSLTARPNLSTIRVVTLALVIGAASAVFVVANAILLRPLPFRDAGRLVRVYMQPPGTTTFDVANPLHPFTFVRMRRDVVSGSSRSTILDAFEGVWAQERSIDTAGDPESVPSASVSAGLFAVVGAAPIAGRIFTEAEADDDRKLVVLGHALWARRFGARADAVGRMLTIDRVPHEIVGVMGADFEPMYVRSELWTPLAIREGRLAAPNASFVQTVGRLRAGTTAGQAQQELAARLSALRPESPANLTGWGIGVRDLRSATYGTQTRALVLLLASVLALALVAAANLANLTLADVLSRRGELAVRAALGASRPALVRPEVAASLIIAAAGSAAGLAIASWSVPALVALDPSSRLDTVRFALDWRVLLSTVTLATLVMSTAAVLPALRVARGDVVRALAEGGRRTAGGRGHDRLRAWLVATQTALAVILVSAGTLVTAALDRTSALDPGFDPANVLTAQLRLPEAVYDTAEKRAAFVADVLARVRAVPGVVDASTTMNLFVPGFAFQTLVVIDGRPTPTGEPHTVLFRRVSPGYFRTLRIAELRGRTFDARDVASGMATVVVSRSFAEQFWPGADPLGRRLRRTGPNAPWLTVVGVVGDGRDLGYGQAPSPVIYTPYAQNNVAVSPVSLVVRAAADPAAIAPAVRDAVRQVDPAQPLANVSTLEAFLGDSLGPQRFRSVLLAIFGSLGLLLAVVGIYAVTARSVVERTREVGVRLALGGRPRQVWSQVAWSAVQPFGAGLLGGIGGALAVAALLAGVFPEVQATPRASMVPAVIVLALVGLTTAVAAARRAATVDPLIALRGE
jgi:predicted permease